MAGGYAHVLAARSAVARVEDWTGLSDDLRFALTMFRSHVEIGSVCPDYPYLMLPPGDQGRWADAMHYTQTAAPVRAGIRSLRHQARDGTDWKRAAAWLFGYAAHLATDLTIHPVVQAIVGPYHENQTRHRVCEMNQDAHIWQRTNLGRIGAADIFQQAHEQVSTGRGLDAPVKALWQTMLREAYPDLSAELPPEIDRWHSGYVTIIDVVDETPALPAFGRHILRDSGNAYPRLDEVDPQYIKDIPTPAGTMDYDAVFDRAVESIGAVWSAIGLALEQPAEAEVILAALPDANLDTGEMAPGTLVMWSVT